MKTLSTLLLLVAASAAYAQSASILKDAPKPRPDPDLFYTPYTGPGFGNPDAKARESESIGASKKKFHDASGASAYSKSGTPEATSLEAPPRKPKSVKKDEKEKKNAGSVDRK